MTVISFVQIEWLGDGRYGVDHAVSPVFGVERFRAAQDGPGPGRVGGCVVAVEFGAGGEDALDGAVARVADRDGPRAGRLQAGIADGLAQREDALSAAQPVDGVDCHELGDHLATGRSDLGGHAGDTRSGCAG